MTLLEELIQYSEQVVSGEITACQKHKWACQRFLNDLDREDFPFIFDEEKAQRFLDWMRLFKHRKGVLKGQHIEPDIIQKFVFGNIYGWVHKVTGYRRFNKAYWQVGRKNAKSQSLGCVGSYETMAMGEGASEVYCAATKTEQAKIVWEETQGMLNGCEELQGKYRIAYGRITHLKTGSFMKALSKEDRKSGDGLNPQAGIIDEYHAHETSEIYDIIDSGMIARPQPLLMIITTAGFELNHPCYVVEYKYVSQILDPNNPIGNENYFVMINELDKDEEGNLVDDIKNEAAWPKANPIACSYPEGVESIRKRLKIALEVPEKMRDFLTKTMNVWVDNRPGGYMNMEKWAKCGRKIDMEYLRGRDVYIGGDLSAKIDLTSLNFEFPILEEEDIKYYIISHSFMPRQTMIQKMKTDKVQYDMWEKQGYITVTDTFDGAVVDYRIMMKYIDDMVEKYEWNIKQIGPDPHNATQFMVDMSDEGHEVVEITQSARNLNEPTTHFREQVYVGNVVHDNNPVLTWSMANAVCIANSFGEIKLDKNKAFQRIDPAAAVICSHKLAMLKEGRVIDVSKYAEEEFLDKLWS